MAERKIWIGIFKTLIEEAKIANDLQPFPSSALLLTKDTQKQVNELKNRQFPFDVISCEVLKFGVIVEKDEDGDHVASVPKLPSCHTQAKTLDEVMKRIKEAIEGYNLA